MAYALVGTIGTAVQGTSGAAISPAFGTGESRTAGNLLICWIAGSGSNSLPAVSSGWNVAANALSTVNATVAIWFRIATGADAAPTVAAVTSTVLSAQLAEFSGNNAVTGSVIQWNGSALGTTSPVTATQGGFDDSAGQLFVICSSDFRSTARASNDTLTSNNATITQAGNNNATTIVNHYSFGYGNTTANGSADNAVVTLSNTQNITGIALCSGSCRLAPIPVIPDIFRQPLSPPHSRFLWT